MAVDGLLHRHLKLLHMGIERIDVVQAAPRLFRGLRWSQTLQPLLLIFRLKPLLHLQARSANTRTR